MANDGIQTSAYANWDEAMRREPSDFRYRSMVGIADIDEYAGSGLKPEDCGEFKIARDKAAKRIVDLMISQSITADEIAKRTGCLDSLLSNMKNGKRSFCVPVKSWELMAYDIMHTSVHELLLGENRPLTLPKKYSVPAAMIQTNLTSSEQDRLAAVSSELVKVYRSESKNDCGHYRPIGNLIRERIKDIKEDYGFYNYQIFGSRGNGTETPACLKSGLSAFWSQSESVPKYSFLAYAALYYKEQNLDYLVSEDPIRDFFDTFAISESGEKVLLTGSNKKFWKDVLILDPARKQRLLGIAWTNIFYKIL